MWIIVNFLSDNSVSAVPKIWWKNGFCAWPKKFIKNKNRYIESLIEPKKSEFDYYKARILSDNPIGE